MVANGLQQIHQMMQIRSTLGADLKLEMAVSITRELVLECYFPLPELA